MIGEIGTDVLEQLVAYINRVEAGNGIVFENNSIPSYIIPHPTIPMMKLPQWAPTFSQNWQQSKNVSFTRTVSLIEIGIKLILAMFSCC